MAESDQFRKKTRPVVWIIFILVGIALVVWMFVDRSPSTTSTHETGISGIQTEPLTETDDWNVDPVTWGDDSFMDEDDNAFGADYSGAVGTDVTAPEEARFSRLDAFIAFTDETEASELNRKTAYEGMVKLAAALTAYTEKDKLDNLIQLAERMKEDEMASRQAQVISETFAEAASIIKEIQQDQYPDLNNEVQQVEQAASKINTEDLASNQSDAIMEFFNQAADTLEAMREA